MSKIKNLAFDIAEKLGKDFDEVTNEDIQFELYNQAQEVFTHGALSQEELDLMRNFLPTKSVKDFNGNVGDVVSDNTGTFYLLTD